MLKPFKCFVTGKIYGYHYDYDDDNENIQWLISRLAIN